MYIIYLIDTTSMCFKQYEEGQISPLKYIWRWAAARQGGRRLSARGRQDEVRRRGTGAGRAAPSQHFLTLLLVTEVVKFQYCVTGIIKLSRKYFCYTKIFLTIYGTLNFFYVTFSSILYIYKYFVYFCNYIIMSYFNITL